jgi:hypothetical protein
VRERERERERARERERETTCVFESISMFVGEKEIVGVNLRYTVRKRSKHD